MRLYKIPLETPGPAELVATYLLPAFRNLRVLDLMCRADPSPYSPPNQGPRPSNEPEKDEMSYKVVWPSHGAAPFQPALGNRILVLTITIISVDEDMQLAFRRNYTAFMKTSMLLELWKSIPREGEGAPTVPWEAWGPENSRILQETTDMNCVCYVYGLRYARCEFGSDKLCGEGTLNFGGAPSTCLWLLWLTLGSPDALPVIPGTEGQPCLRVMDFNDSGFDSAIRKDSAEHLAAEKIAVSIHPAPQDIQIPGTFPGEDEETVPMDDDGDDDWVDEDEEEEEENGIDTDMDDDEDMPVIRRPEDAIKEFNGLRIKDKAALEQCRRTQIAYHPSYIGDATMFEEPLETRLRFRWAVRESATIAKFQRVMIDDEHIIGIKVSLGRGVGSNTS